MGLLDLNNHTMGLLDLSFHQLLNLDLSLVPVKQSPTTVNTS